MPWSGNGAWSPDVFSESISWSTWGPSLICLTRSQMSSLRDGFWFKVWYNTTTLEAWTNGTELSYIAECPGPAGYWPLTPEGGLGSSPDCPMCTFQTDRCLKAIPRPKYWRRKNRSTSGTSSHQQAGPCKTQRRFGPCRKRWLIGRIALESSLRVVHSPAKVFRAKFGSAVHINVLEHHSSLFKALQPCRLLWSALNSNCWSATRGCSIGKI